MTHQKMRPLPTVSKHALVELITRVILENLDDPADVADSTARQILEALGLECAMVTTKVPRLALYTCLSEEEAKEMTRERHAVALGRFMLAEGPMMEQSQKNIEGDLQFRHSFWTINPRGPHLHG